MVEGTMPDKSFNEELEDSEYSRKSEFSKATITQTQVSKCLELRSRDMRPGYTTWSSDKSGSFKPTVVQDSRKEFVSSVEALKNMLAPEIDQKKPELEELYNEAKEISFKKYAYHEKIGKVWKDGKAIWKYSGRIFMPQKGTPILCNDGRPLSTGTSINPNAWDHLIDAYWDELVDYADELFAELNRLIHILDYFKGGTSM
jgi:hypothetical protein